MKKFLIECDTNWCGTNAAYRATADSIDELWDIAEQLAYENFQQYDLWKEIAVEEGYDPDDMTEGDWDSLYQNSDESEYYNYVINPFEGTEEEWEEIGGDIYNSKSLS